MVLLGNSSVKAYAKLILIYHFNLVYSYFLDIAITVKSVTGF